MVHLSGRKALVTGGSRGIGAASAKALLRAGAEVAICARNRNALDAFTAELDSQERAHSFVADLSDAEQSRQMANRVREQLGGADILVNNAGGAISAPLKRTSLDDWNRLFALNATSAFVCAQVLAPGMLEQGWGRIVNLASVAGLSGGRYICAYSASKHALVGLTRCLAAELAGSAITANAVCPGYVDTEMTRHAVRTVMNKTGCDESTATRKILETTGQPRLVETREVAETVVWLCGDAAAGINGQTIVVDGGGRIG